MIRRLGSGSSFSGDFGTLVAPLGLDCGSFEFGIGIGLWRSGSRAQMPGDESVAAGGFLLGHPHEDEEDGGGLFGSEHVEPDVRVFAGELDLEFWEVRADVGDELRGVRDGPGWWRQAGGFERADCGARSHGFLSESL
jgi:hypothetical protein